MYLHSSPSICYNDFVQDMDWFKYTRYVYGDIAQLGERYVRNV